MPRFILKKLKDQDNHFDTTDVIIRVDSVSLDDVVEGMDTFIKACGFYPKGTLEYVYNNEELTTEDASDEL